MLLQNIILELYSSYKNVHRDASLCLPLIEIDTIMVIWRLREQIYNLSLIAVDASEIYINNYNRLKPLWWVPVLETTDRDWC